MSFSKRGGHECLLFCPDGEDSDDDHVEDGFAQTGEDEGNALPEADVDSF